MCAAFARPRVRHREQMIKWSLAVRRADVEPAWSHCMPNLSYRCKSKPGPDPCPRPSNEPESRERLWRRRPGRTAVATTGTPWLLARNSASDDRYVSRNSGSPTDAKDLGDVRAPDGHNGSVFEVRDCHCAVAGPCGASCAAVRLSSKSLALAFPTP